MAKKSKLETGDFNIDYDLDFNDFGVEEVKSKVSKEASNKKSRIPVTETFKSAMSSARSKFTDPSFLAKVTKEALPKQYGDVLDKTDKAAGALSSLYDDAIKDIKPQLSRLSKKVDKLVPNEQKMLKTITTNFKKLMGDSVETSSIRNSNAQFQDQSIANSITEIFNRQFDAQKADSDKGDIETKIKESIDNKRFSSNFGLLSSIDQGVTRTANYTEKVTQAFQKKSLELQFRSYFVQAELLEVTKKNSEIVKAQNDSIVKNTALPEFVKINNNERFTELARTKFFGSIQNTLFGDDNILTKALNKLKTQAKDVISGVKFGLEQSIEGLDALDQINEQNKMLQEMGQDPVSNAHIFGAGLGDFAAGKIGGLFSSGIKNNIKDSSKFSRFGYKAADFANNMAGKVKGFKNSDFIKRNEFEGGIKGKAASFAKYGLDLFNNDQPDMYLDRKENLTSLKGAAIFDNKSYSSITDVIPGYLARIHREISMLRTNDESTPLTLYDHKTGKFVNKKQLASDIKDSLKDKLKSSLHGYTLNESFKDIFGKSNLDEEQSSKVKGFISDLSTISMDYTPENIKNTNLFKSLDKDTAKIISDTLDNKVTSSDIPEKGQYDLTNSIMSVRNKTPDIRGEIELFVNAGYSDVLEEEGLIKRSKEGGYIINFDKYKEMVKESSIIKSDINVKRNISKLSSKDAYRAIKNTKLYNWFYKNGKGDQKAHVGPMAQDVNRNMGAEVSDGQGIDPANMNGVTLATVQEILNRLEKLSKGGDNTLTDIKKDTGSIVDILNNKGTKRNIKNNNNINTSRTDDTSNENSKSKFREGNSYKDILLNLFSMASDTAFKVGSDLFSGARKLGTTANRFILKPLTNMFNSNKDETANMFKKLFTSAGELSVKALKVTSDVVFNKLPEGYKQLAELVVKGKDKLLNMIDQPTDIYVKGFKTPSIKANLMKMGYYIDQATGNVINSFDDIKGPVIDKLGNVVLSVEDISQGLFNNKGEQIKNRFTKVIELAIGTGLRGLSTLKNLSSKFLGSVGGFDISNKFKSMTDSISSSFNSGIGGGKSYNVLVEIRDILKHMSGMKDSSSDGGKPKYDEDGNIVSDIFSKVKDSEDEREPATIRRRRPVFNDRDNSGERDGSWKDRLVKEEEREKARRERINKDDKVAPRYKSETNVMDFIFNKAKSLFSLLGGGATSMFSTASDILSGAGTIKDILGSIGGGLKGLIKSPLKTVAGIGSGIMGLGKLIPGAGAVGSMASTAKNLFMAGSLLTTGTGGAILSASTAAISALGALLSSPVVLGAVAVSAAAYGAYKGYKYLTRNKITEFEDIRIKQYGLTNSGDDKEYNSKILELEDYLLNNGVIGYNQGEAYIFPMKLDAKKVISIFSIDEGDKEQINKFQQWFNGRFKPFFLTHVTALYSVDTKVRLNDLSKLEINKQINYLELIGYENGPYDEIVSPFKGKQELTNTKNLTKDTIDVLLAKLVKERIKKNKDIRPSVDVSKNIEINKIPSINQPYQDKPIPKYDTKIKKSENLDIAEDGLHRPDISIPMKLSNDRSKIKEALGGINPGDNAGQYINLAPGVKLDGVNPSLLRNLKGMIEEYGETTGNKVTITSGSRSSKEQEALYRQNPNKAARPGTSLHEFGLAVDINSSDLDAMDNLGLMRKYGFTRPVGGEAWHTEPAGIQANLKGARDSSSLASSLIEASLYKGGGGVGSMKGSPLGKRDTAYALGLMDIDATKIKPSNDKVSQLITTAEQSKQEVMSEQPKPGLRLVSNNTSSSGGYGGSMNQPSNNITESYTRNDISSDSEVKPTSSSKTESFSGAINANDTNAVKIAISNIAGRNGVDPNLMKGFAAVESSLNPNAESSTSGAKGLYQFVPNTWKGEMQKFGRKFNIPEGTGPKDVRASTLLASQYVKDNSRFLKPVKNDINITDIYLAHLLGPTGARRLLTALKNSPEALAKDVVPNAAKGNHNLFYSNNKPLTVIEFYNNISKKLDAKAKSFNINLPPSSASLEAESIRETAANSAGNITETSLGSSYSGSMSGDDTGRNTNTREVVTSNTRDISFGGQPSPVGDFSSRQKPIDSGNGFNLDKGLTTVNDTLEKSLVVQTQMYEALKQIVLNTAPVNNKNDLMKVKEPSANAISNREITSAIDLKRKVS